jgi:hypothetical protein
MRLPVLSRGVVTPARGVLSEEVRPTTAYACGGPCLQDAEAACPAACSRCLSDGKGGFTCQK